MSKLTTKQEKYVQELVTGLSQRKAYRRAYPSSVKWKDSTVDSHASRLLATDKVMARYNELMDEHKDKALWTREKAVDALIWLVERSKESIENQDEGYVRQGTSGALVNAIQELNKLELLYPLDQRQAQKVDADLDVSSDKSVHIVADVPNVIGGSDE